MTERIAVIFDNFGPYHFARVAAAARQMNVIGIEVTAKSQEYEWQPGYESSTVALHTLFTAAESQSPSGAAVVRKRLWELLGRLSPKFVAVPGWASPAAFAALEWCIAYNVPALVMSESTAGDASRNAVAEAIKRQVISLFSAGLVGGHPQAAYLEKLGMSAEQIFTGYDAVDNDYFAQGADEARTRIAEVQSHFRLPEHYFLASARFVEKKNLPRLIQAYARYREHTLLDTGDSSPWHLLLLGDGPLKSDLRHLISDFGLQDSIILPGFIQYNELPSFYGLAETFIHASTTEQWGLVVNEAMASGLPVLVSKHCGCAVDLVAEDVNGILFDPYDVAAIATAMSKIANLSDVERAAMGRSARQRIAAFSPDAFATGLRSAADWALRNRTKAPSLAQRVLLRALANRTAR